eukprot:1286679-Amphidinium_carterae.1
MESLDRLSYLLEGNAFIPMLALGTSVLQPWRFSNGCRKMLHHALRVTRDVPCQACLFKLTHAFAIAAQLNAQSLTGTRMMQACVFAHMPLPEHFATVDTDITLQSLVSNVRKWIPSRKLAAAP